MKPLHYPRKALAADAARAGIGLVLTVPPLLFIDMLVPVAAIFAALALTFAWFGARTLCRARSTYRLTPEGVSAEGCHRASVSWRELSGFRLRHFRPRRNPAEGWIEMRLRAGAQSVMIESRLEGFDEIAAAAAAAARARDLPFDARTEDALVSLGLTQGLKAAGTRWDWRSVKDPGV